MKDTSGCENCFEIMFYSANQPKRENLLLSCVGPKEKDEWITVTNQYFEINPSGKLSLEVSYSSSVMRRQTGPFILSSPMEGEIIKVSLPTFLPNDENDSKKKREKKKDRKKK